MNPLLLNGETYATGRAAFVSDKVEVSAITAVLITWI